MDLMRSSPKDAPKPLVSQETVAGGWPKRATSEDVTGLAIRMVKPARASRSHRCASRKPPMSCLLIGESLSSCLQIKELSSSRRRIGEPSSPRLWIGESLSSRLWIGKLSSSRLWIEEPPPSRLWIEEPSPPHHRIWDQLQVAHPEAATTHGVAFVRASGVIATDALVEQLPLRVRGWALVAHALG